MGQVSGALGVDGKKVGLVYTLCRAGHMEHIVPRPILQEHLSQFVGVGKVEFNEFYALIRKISTATGGAHSGPHFGPHFESPLHGKTPYEARSTSD